ncbi:MAG: TIGR03790 family protein [Fimbriimonadaceae bacterium]|nr:TIGR03790 family protein [Fimbriimonadaceae bacterium]
MANRQAHLSEVASVKILMLLSALSICLITSCSQPSPELTVNRPVESTTTYQQASPDARRVLVVMNKASEASRQIAEFYMVRRKIPKDNLLEVNMSTSDNVPDSEYKTFLEDPIRKKIAGLRQQIDFIVLTKGVPIRLRDNNGYSVDGHIATMNLPIKPIEKLEETQIRSSMNPYFGKAEKFDSKKFNFYLVTRLDGYTIEDALRLVTNSLKAEVQKGPFLFDCDPGRKGGGYKDMQDGMLTAAKGLRDRGFDVSVDETMTFTGSNKPLAGYCSWGSNDGNFDANVYKSLRFVPGAIGETFVSTSGRTFSPTTGGQSLVADLIAGGLTGIKGYVSEPYTFALARPEILFDRYTKGFNLAESFYMSSQVLKWKDLVIGDPLCSPYATKG